MIIDAALVETDKILYSAKYKDAPGLQLRDIQNTASYLLEQFKRNKLKNSLLAIDYLIQFNKSRFTFTGDMEPEIFDSVVKSISTSSLAYSPADWDDFFKKDIWKTKIDQRKLGFVLLHILSNDFEGVAFPKIKNYKLVDFLSITLPDVGKRLKIDSQQQNYEQLKHWKDFGREILPEFQKLDMNDTTQYLKNRENINRTYAKLRSVFQNLFYFEGQDAFPENVFNEMTTFKEDIANGDFKKAYNHMGFLERLLKKILEYDSRYIRLFVFPLLFNTITNFRGELLATNKPSNLSLDSGKRKYPFTDKQSQIILKLVVENKGGGFASNVNMDIKFNSNISIKGSKQSNFSKYWAQLGPGSVIIDIPITLNKEFNTSLTGFYEIMWNDWDLDQKRLEGQIVYNYETRQVDWLDLENTERYSTKPVSSEEDFIGKESKINPIYKDIVHSLSSSWFFGQKRVGKTSTLLGIKRELEKLDKFIVVNTNYGEFSHSEPKTLIDQMAGVIIQEIKYKYNYNIEAQTFNGSLTPLIAYLKAVYNVSKKKIFIMIDEFDELPFQFFNLNAVSQPFWQSLRSISMSEHTGILLVGGENVQKLKVSWGSSLNLLRTHRADKFKREEFQDYAELIRKPVVNELEFTDDAIQEIFAITGGNPFFTKLLCKVVQSQSCKKHNSYISFEEVQNAINETVLYEAEMEHFQHFIEDGLKGDEANIKIWQQQRAKFLFIVSKCLNEEGKADVKYFKELCIKTYQIPDVDFNNLHSEFIERNIYNAHDGLITFEIPLFSKFLKIRGNVLLPPFFKADEDLEQRLEMERKLIVKNNEIADLIEKWSLYQGNVITIDRVQNWLMQFGDLYVQREIFEVLKQIRFISREGILKGLRYAYKMAITELDFEINSRLRLRDDIYVGYLDGAGKSGAWIAHQFKDVNGILKQNILELSQLNRVTQESTNPFKKMKALILADDFSGTGKTLIDELTNNIEMIKVLYERHSVKVILYSAFAMEEGRENIINFIKSQDLIITPIFGEVLDESEKIFSDSSRYFDNPETKEKVRFIMTELGNKIVSKNPLGFGDCEVGIIFPENCPNNTLPVFWAKKTSNAFNWQPLFPRLLN